MGGRCAAASAGERGQRGRRRRPRPQPVRRRVNALDRALDDPRLAAFWARLHRRYGASAAPVRRVAVTGAEERVAIAELLRSAAPPTGSVAVQRLAVALGLDDDQLRVAVELRLGPAGDRAAARADRSRARQEAADRLAQAAARIDPALEDWARRRAVVIDGQLDPQVHEALTVLGIIAAPRPRLVPRPVVAADHLGDPHALDDDRRLGRLLVGALAARWGVETAASDARARRALLRRIGIVADELSSTVTVLRLPVAGHGARWTALAGNEPAAVTLDQLVRERLVAARSARPVHVVENPAVLSAAALAGTDASFVCTSGVPSVAALELLDQLTAQGVELRAHADFDAAGVAIVDRLVAAGARPWMMTAADYLDAPASAVRLERPPTDVPWAPGLADAMIDRGVAVYEEQVVSPLLAAATS
ncbi:DUF2399 domain-containing protein [Nitriliruptoraceae bacterium ZYF776]|nr:DUF2399 domain-containing protein [Profundirhabdus halotolerans]